MTTPVFNMTDTWNNFATSFTAIKMSVTNAGSAADSKLLDLLLGGASRFSVGITGSFIADSLSVGTINGNAIQLGGSPAGSFGATIGVDPASADPAVNVHIIPKGAGGVNSYSNGALQLSVTGPPSTTRYITVTGSAAGNPTIAASGGGRVEINNLLMVGAPEAPTPPDADNDKSVATTEFVKRQQYVKTIGPVTSLQLVGFNDVPNGLVLEGINMPASGLAKVGGELQLTDDLAALEALNGTNTIYYRSGLSTWTPVDIDPTLSFTGGTIGLAPGAGGVTDAQFITASAHGGLTAERVLTDSATITWDFSVPGQATATSTAGGGNVSTSGAITPNLYAKWATPTTIQSVPNATVVADIGAQPLDATLTALGGLATGADLVPYFTGLDTADTFTTSLFARNVLMPLATPTDWLLVLGAAPIDSPLFTTAAFAPTPVTASNDQNIATTAFVKAQGYQTSTQVTAAIAAQAQPLDGDLTSLAAASATNSMYYRSAANTWNPVTIGANLTFTGGTLAGAAGGGGNVSSVGTPVNTQVAQWTGATTIQGVPLATWRTSPTFYGSVTFANAVSPVGNGLTMNTAASGGNPTFVASGQDANIGIFFSSKGDSSTFFYSRSFGSPQLMVGPGSAGSDTFMAFNASVGQSILTNNPATNPITVGCPMNLANAGSTAVTPTPGDKSTKIATTAFVNNPRKDAFVATKNGVDQTGIGIGPATKLTFGTEVFDDGGLYDAAQSRWTPSAGTVVLSATIFILSGGTAGANQSLSIHKNGIALRSSTAQSGTNTQCTVAIMVVDLANGTDFYELFINPVTGSTVSVYGNIGATYFQGWKI